MAGSREGFVSGEMNNRGRRSHIRRRVVQDDDQERPNSREDENAERRTLRASYRELQHTIQGVSSVSVVCLFLSPSLIRSSNLT